jgi:hypothetical protein
MQACDNQYKKQAPSIGGTSQAPAHTIFDESGARYAVVRRRLDGRVVVYTVHAGEQLELVARAVLDIARGRVCRGYDDIPLVVLQGILGVTQHPSSRDHHKRSGR